MAEKEVIRKQKQVKKTVIIKEDYFEGLGFPCAIHFNPADFLSKYMFCYIALK
jgi:hypothetical protein